MTRKKNFKNIIPWPGFEPGLSRPQREVLTTRLSWLFLQGMLMNLSVSLNFAVGVLLKWPILLFHIYCEYKDTIHWNFIMNMIITGRCKATYIACFCVCVRVRVSACTHTYTCACSCVSQCMCEHACVGKIVFVCVFMCACIKGRYIMHAWQEWHKQTSCWTRQIH